MVNTADLASTGVTDLWNSKWVLWPFKIVAMALIFTSVVLAWVNHATLVRFNLNLDWFHMVCAVCLVVTVVLQTVGRRIGCNPFRGDMFNWTTYDVTTYWSPYTVNSHRREDRCCPTMYFFTNMCMWLGYFGYSYTTIYILVEIKTGLLLPSAICAVLGLASIPISVLTSFLLRRRMKAENEEATSQEQPPYTSDTSAYF